MVDQCPLWSRFFLGSLVNKSLSFLDQFSLLISPLSGSSTKRIVESYQSDKMVLDYSLTGRKVRVIYLTEMPGLGLILKLVEVCLVMDGVDLLVGEVSSAGCVLIDNWKRNCEVPLCSVLN